MQALIHNEQQPGAVLLSRLPDDHHSHAQQDADLDDFDVRLLAEPAPPFLWQSSDGVPTGRLSLPNNTAPLSPANPFKRQKPLYKHRAQYVHTPLAQRNSSSPLNAPLSSPSFRVKKLQTARALRPSANLTTNSPSSDHLPSQVLFNNGRKRRPQVCDDNQPVQHASLSSSPSLQPSTKPQLELHHAQPLVQGIRLISLNQLPDRLRSVFRHPLFNAIQSKCFPIAYQTNDNFVISAPTGGGKTVILEMAICRLVSGFQTGQYKIVYMAPTKSLCSEKHRDWQAKFSALDLQCAELTGDTEHGQLRSVQSASIIITTPEKWDSMTRRWKDHAILMQMVRLFLIDEVHILKDTRGATLEAVVSRMKSVGSNVRFVALSATVPNSEDIAKWLGKDPMNQHVPALRERFGEEFRPVRLQKHVIGLPYKGNDFGFEGVCDPRLPDIVAKYTHKKPIMVFCITRNSTVSTAKLLANVWASKSSRDRQWEGPTRKIVVQDPELRNTLTSGVAFHHAGLVCVDRHAIEKGFLEGQINVICCTSTLAVGVNLPCHMVIIKNTMGWSDDGLKEYADLEVMQMLGRAGRPQFDTTAVAVIITKQEKLTRYERLVTGEELLESCLHLNLIDHLNAEIGLGTINDLYSAKRWLRGTFLYVRLSQNPDHYKLDEDTVDLDLDDRIERICKRDLTLLEQSNLITCIEGRLKATELGDAMARYYVQFGTMQVLLHLEPRAKMSDMLSAIVQAREFIDIRLKSYEKKLFKELNRANGIKFPIKVDLAIHAHKRSLILQAELGGVEFPADEQYAKYKRQYNLEKTMLFSHVHRLVHCMIDCQIYKQDAVAVRHALELARSLGARVWDNSPYEMKQMPQIGPVAIRKLAIGGINSLEALEGAEPHRIELLLSKNPPFGQKLLDNLKAFPKLRVSIKTMGKEISKGRPIIIKIKIECGFMNEKVPMTFLKKSVYICLLTERSDGHLIDFKRISAKNLNNGKDFLMSAEVHSHMQYITCYIMCDTIAGTLRYAELKPDVPANLFPPIQTRYRQTATVQGDPVHDRSRQLKDTSHTSSSRLENDEFEEDELGDQDMVDAVTGIHFRHIDNVTAGSHGYDSKSRFQDHKGADSGEIPWNPQKLNNGKWACNHKCKDKANCKHMCCRDGVDKAPKPPKSAFVPTTSLVDKCTSTESRQTTTPPPPAKNIAFIKSFAKGRMKEIETLNLIDQSEPGGRGRNQPTGLKSLQRLHEKVVKGSAFTKMVERRPLNDSTMERQLQLPSANSPAPATGMKELQSDCDRESFGGLPSPSALLDEDSKVNERPFHDSTDYGSSFFPSASALPLEKTVTARERLDTDPLEDFDLSQLNNGNEQSDLEAAMVGLSDSVIMHEDSQTLPLHGDIPIGATAADRLVEEGKIAYRLTKSRAINHWNDSGKLFLSTDSPEKPANLPGGRREITASKIRDSPLSLSEPGPKGQRLGNEADTAMRPLSQAANQTPPKAPMIKPGQPAWVHNFDPEFIAEWQDIVEFV